MDNRVSCVDGQARDGFVGAARWSVLPADGGQGEETEQRRTCKNELEYPRLSVSSVHKRLVKIFLERRPVWGLVSSSGCSNIPELPSFGSAATYHTRMVASYRYQWYTAHVSVGYCRQLPCNRQLELGRPVPNCLIARTHLTTFCFAFEIKDTLHQTTANSGGSRYRNWPAYRLAS